jgi:hypothetical protein
MSDMGFSALVFAMKYPTTIIIEKLNNRNHKTNQLLVFLPDIPNENCMSISHAKTRNGKPSNIAISENLTRSSAEMYGERNALITSCPHIP